MPNGSAGLSRLVNALSGPSGRHLGVVMVCQADRRVPKLWGRNLGWLQTLMSYCYNFSSASCGSADPGPDAPSVACNERLS